MKNQKSCSSTEVATTTASKNWKPWKPLFDGGKARVVNDIFKTCVEQKQDTHEGKESNAPESNMKSPKQQR